MSENKELDVALVNIETKFRVETYPMKLGASEEAAKLISSSSDRIKKFVYDGLDLRFGKSDFQPRCFAFARTKFERRTSRRRVIARLECQDKSSQKDKICEADVKTISQQRCEISFAGAATYRRSCSKVDVRRKRKFTRSRTPCAGLAAGGSPAMMAGLVSVAA